MLFSFIPSLVTNSSHFLQTGFSLFSLLFSPVFALQWHRGKLLCGLVPRYSHVTMTMYGELNSVPTLGAFFWEAQAKALSVLFKYFLGMYKVEISRSNQFGLTASPSKIPIKSNSGHIRRKDSINCWKHYSLML